MTKPDEPDQGRPRPKPSRSEEALWIIQECANDLRDIIACCCDGSVDVSTSTPSPLSSSFHNPSRVSPSMSSNVQVGRLILKTLRLVIDHDIGPKHTGELHMWTLRGKDILADMASGKFAKRSSIIVIWEAR